jgi:hypothetical protein
MTLIWLYMFKTTIYSYVILIQNYLSDFHLVVIWRFRYWWSLLRIIEWWRWADWFFMVWLMLLLNAFQNKLLLLYERWGMSNLWVAMSGRSVIAFLFNIRGFYNRHVTLYFNWFRDYRDLGFSWFFGRLLGFREAKEAWKREIEVLDKVTQ